MKNLSSLVYIEYEKISSSLIVFLTITLLHEILMMHF